MTIFYKYWWLFTVRGISLCLVGAVVLVLVNSGATPSGTFFPLYLLFEGSLSFVPLFSPNEHRGKWIFLFQGSTSIALGVLYFVWPKLISLISADAAMGMRLHFIAIWALITGLSGFAACLYFKMPKPLHLKLVIGSTFPLALSGILFIQKELETRGLILILAAFALFFGAFLILFGMLCRNSSELNRIQSSDNSF